MGGWLEYKSCIHSSEFMNQGATLLLTRTDSNKLQTEFFHPAPAVVIAISVPPSLSVLRERESLAISVPLQIRKMTSYFFYTFFHSNKNHTFFPSLAILKSLTF